MNRYTWRTGLLEVVMILVGVLFAFPLYVLLNISFRTQNDPTSPLLPSLSPTIQNYQDALGGTGLDKALLASIAIAAMSVAVGVVLASMAAYAIVRVSSRVSGLLFWTFLIGLLIPFQIGMIPLYFTMRDLHLLGNWLSLVVFYVGIQMPFSIFLYAGFLRALPTDYEEAAWIDGASPGRAFWLVVFPLLRPITGTVIILNAITTWNDLLTPLLYLSGTPVATVPVVIMGFVDQYVSNWPVIFAALVIGTGPILITFFILQRSVVKGFASGLKG